MEQANYEVILRDSRSDFELLAETAVPHADEVFHYVATLWQQVEARVSGKINQWDMFETYDPARRTRHPDIQLLLPLQDLRVRLLVVLKKVLKSLPFEPESNVNFLRSKNESYGGSWKRRGGVGAFMMLARKWDRIETLSGQDGDRLRKAITADTAGIIDDFVDLYNYCLLVAEHIHRLAAEARPLPPALDPAEAQGRGYVDQDRWDKEVA